MILHFSARQPVVALLEDVLERTTSKWDKSDDQMQTRIDTLLQLQRDRLQLEKDRLEFKRQLAGLATADKKHKTSKKGIYLFCSHVFMADQQCTDTKYFSLLCLLHWLSYVQGMHLQ